MRGCAHLGGGAVENLKGGGLKSTWGELGGLKMLLKNTCDEVHLIVKLLAISLQACRFRKLAKHILVNILFIFQNNTLKFQEKHN